MVANKTTNLNSKLSRYAEQVYQEWVDGSAIAPEIFAANVVVVPDEIISLGGDVSYPIHEALNWDVMRWRTSLTGRIQRPEKHGAIIYTTDPIAGNRTVFQVKLENPVLDKTKGKPRKYENPIGRGQVGGFATVPQSIWNQVSERYSCPVDPNRSFWSWVIAHPELPIIICEGMKKACALLSQGYVAIALSGITMGRINDGKGNVDLQPYLKVFAAPERPVYFCFDAETKSKTKFALHLAQVKTGKLFADADCAVKIIQLPLLPNTDKTGVDDFIVACGPDALEQVYAAALPLASYQWQWRHTQQLTYKPWIVLNTPELNFNSPLVFPNTQLLASDFLLPQEGIIAIASAKGTGKTKAIAAAVASTPKLALLGHRVSLMRNLCQRLGVDFKGDIDKANGHFITGSAYTLRVGACVDSLLAFDPQSFVGCDLVIDEVEQVLRHLISGATCNKDGKRPALLARLHWLVKVARRIIVADADLSDTSLDYLSALRGDNCPVYLIKNDCQPQGYPVRFIRSHNDTAIVAELLADVAQGDKVFIATDSKANSKAIAKIVQQMHLVRPNAKIMLINSETSGGEIEADFIRNINECCKDYDIVIATPSMSTGVSIEVEWFDKVYGMFYGTVTDADASQALSRVRSNIRRVVWCTERGNNFCRVDRSEFPKQLKDTLKNRWDREVSLIKAGLGAALLPIVEAVTWENPHIELWARVEASNNAAMWSLRDNLIERLKYEGNQVEIADKDGGDEQVAATVKEARQLVKQEHYRAVAGATILSKAEMHALAKKESRTPSELLNEHKTLMALFYGKDNITPELVEFDRDGLRRQQILKLEALLSKDVIPHADLEAIARQAKFERGLFVPDQPCHELGRFIRDKLGLGNLLVLDARYTNADLEHLGNICRACALDVKRYLGFNVPQDATNIWIFRRLCDQLGVTTKSQRVRGATGMVNYCWIDAEAWNALQEILVRRKVKQSELLDQPVVASDRPPVITNRVEGAIAEQKASKIKNGESLKWKLLSFLKDVWTEINGKKAIRNSPPEANDKNCPQIREECLLKNTSQNITVIINPAI